MGNCCGGGEEKSKEHQNLTSASGQRIQKFQGEGHRLGTAVERVNQEPKPAVMRRQDDDTPAPAIDNNLTDEEREKIRADRAAAAEARLKQTAGKKKKKPSTAAPLTGPNTEPLMRWN